MCCRWVYMCVYVSHLITLLACCYNGSTRLTAPRLIRNITSGNRVRRLQNGLPRVEGHVMATQQMTPDVVSIARKTSDETVDRLLYETFLWTGVECYAEVGFSKCVLTDRYAALVDQLEHFEVRDDDIWVAGFPRSGTTWLNEMVWCIVNNLDFEGAKELLSSRCSFHELEMLAAAEPKEVDNYVVERRGPRFIKTHLPWALLPRQIRSGERKPRVLYVTRDPRDVCCSYYGHYQQQCANAGSFDEFVTLFLKDRVVFGPYWAHVDGFMNQMHRDNVMHVAYADMHQALSGVIKRVAAFLNKSYLMYEVIILKQHLSFESICENKALKRRSPSDGNNVESHFSHKGECGAYKHEMTPEMIHEFGVWVQINSK